MTRCVVMGGALVNDDQQGVMDALLREYAAYARRFAVFTEIRNLWDPAHYQAIFAHLGWKFEDHLDVLIDLKDGEEQLWTRLKHFRRKNIKRVEREGVQFKLIETSADAAVAHRYVAELYDRIRLPGPAPEFLNALFERVRPAGSAKYFGAYWQGRLIAARIVLTYGRTIYDYYAGADESITDIPAGAVMPWEVCRWGIANGYDTFDFGGAGRPNIPYGVRDYKLAFGGELVNYGRFTTVHKRFAYTALSVATKWVRSRKLQSRHKAKPVQP